MPVDNDTQAVPDLLVKLGKSGLSAISPRQTPGRRGLPPARVHTAEFDPLRDEGDPHARAMQATGVDVSLTRNDGVVHSFFGMCAAIAKARTAIERVPRALRQHLGD